MGSIFTDGFTFDSNPSPTGGGFTITDNCGRLISRRRIHRSGLTNNEAEVRGLAYAVRIAEEGDIVLSDSQVAIGWVLGGESGARPDLNDRLRRANDRMRKKHLRLKFVRRAENPAGVYNELYPARDR